MVVGIVYSGVVDVLDVIRDLFSFAGKAIGRIHGKEREREKAEGGYIQGII